MNHSFGRYNYDQLWKVIDNPEKFELLSYLILCLKYTEFQVYKTPKTRDNKRDAEGVFDGQKVFSESKFITDVTTKKLSHKEVGSNINIAIYELADLLLIFTNGYVQLDLLNFINWHNDVHESVLQRPLRIIPLNRQQVAMYALRYSESEYLSKLSQLKLKGYKTAKGNLLKTRLEELKITGQEIICDIQKVRQDKSDFHYYPTFGQLVENNWSEQEKSNFVGDLLQCEVYYQSGFKEKYQEKIKVVLGSSFFIVFKISNFFFDDINFSIRVVPDGLLKLMSAISLKADAYLIDSVVKGLSEQIVKIESRIERLPFGEIMSTLQVGKYGFPIKLNKIEVENLFFLAPFIGELNNENLALYKEKIDRVVYEKKFFLSLITGEAGIGKSRFIQEIIDHSKQYQSKVFRCELIAPEGRRTFIKDIIAFFTGIDANSFINSTDQLITRFKTDSNFSSFFSNDLEFDSFKKTVDKVIDTGLDQIQGLELNKIADFIGKILLHLGEKYLTLIVVEDLHHANKSVFSFLVRIYNNLKTQKSKICFLLAARTEAKDITIAYHEFELLISSDPTYSITKMQVQPLSERDSLSLIEELVITDSKFESVIEESVLKKTGYNPFNIIHTLIHLKNIGIIVEKQNDFEWRNITKLKYISFHVEIDKLLKDRFYYYLNLPEINTEIFDLLGIICLFETRVNVDDLNSIWETEFPQESISFLKGERILRTEGASILFDHENIFQYVKDNILPRSFHAGEIVINWIKQNNSEKKFLPLLIRCYNICFQNHKEDFFAYSWKYLEQVIERSDWEQIVRYGEMYLHRGSDHAGVFGSIKSFNVLFAIAEVKSEYSGVSTSIKLYDELEQQLKVALKKFGAIHHKSFPYYLLLLKTRLYKCDVLIMASEYSKGKLILKGLVDEILQLQKANEKYRCNSDLLKLLCWGQNRLGISFRTLGDIDGAFVTMKKSLKLAKQINNEYYIHHNYYDMAGCLIHMDKIKEAFKMHKKCLTPILNQPNYANARARSQIRTGIFYILQNDFVNAEVELENSIQLARDGNYLWELTRGLLNQASLYLQQKNIQLSIEAFKTTLHFIDVHNAKAFNFCLYNNLAFLYLFEFQGNGKIYHLEKSLSCFAKAAEDIKLLVEFSTTKQRTTHDIFSVLNFIFYIEHLKKITVHSSAVTEMLKHSETTYQQALILRATFKTPEFIERFYLQLSRDIGFYVTYMSFS